MKFKQAGFFNILKSWRKISKTFYDKDILSMYPGIILNSKDSSVGESQKNRT